MQRLIPLVLMLTIPSSLFAENRLRIEISGLDPQKGSILALAIYTSSETYEAQTPIATGIQNLSPNSTTAFFEVQDLTQGPLMVIGLQDSNGNLEMDTGLFGIPKEGFFCSQNASVPNWDRCVFSYEGGNALIHLDMIYW